MEFTQWILPLVLIIFTTGLICLLAYTLKILSRIEQECKDNSINIEALNVLLRSDNHKSQPYDTPPPREEKQNSESEQSTTDNNSDCLITSKSAEISTILPNYVDITSYRDSTSLKQYHNNVTDTPKLHRKLMPEIRRQSPFSKIKRTDTFRAKGKPRIEIKPAPRPEIVTETETLLPPPPEFLLATSILDDQDVKNIISGKTETKEIV